MRWIAVVLMLLVGVVLAGCGGDSSLQGEETEIVGIWQGELEGWYCQLVFYEDHSGSMDYQHPRQRTKTNFDWSIDDGRLVMIVTGGSGLNEVVSVGNDIGGSYKWLGGNLSIHHPDTDIPTVYYPKGGEEPITEVQEKTERIASLPLWHTGGGVLASFTIGGPANTIEARSILEILLDQGHEFDGVRLEITNGRYFRLFGNFKETDANHSSLLRDSLLEEFLQKMDRLLKPEYPGYSVLYAVDFAPILGDITAIDKGISLVLKNQSVAKVCYTAKRPLSQAQAERIRGLLFSLNLYSVVVKDNKLTMKFVGYPEDWLRSACDDIDLLLSPEFELTMTGAEFETFSGDDLRIAAKSLAKMLEDIPGLGDWAVTRIRPSQILVEIEGSRDEDLSRVREVIMTSNSWKQNFPWILTETLSVRSMTTGM